jgi:hypothetical protein
MPISSSYHPTNHAPISSRILPMNFTISSATEEADSTSTAWYEQQDLKSLVVANNEIAVLEEEIGGFEDLEILDVSLRSRIDSTTSTSPLISTLTDPQQLPLSPSDLPRLPHEPHDPQPLIQ